MHTIRIRSVGPALAVALLFTACASDEPETSMNESASQDSANQSVSQSPFGTTPDGEQVTQYTFRNAHGMEVSVINFGGIITHRARPADADAAYRTAFGDPACVKMILDWREAA